jgi:hypothetical protein
MAHFIAWQRFDLVTGSGPLDAWRSAQDIIRMRAAPGDVVWLLTSFRYRRRIIAPALLGRLSISEVKRNDAHWRGATIPLDKKATLFLPMNNAYQFLQSLKFTGAATSFNPSRCQHCQKALASGNPYSNVGLHFMRIRTLQQRSVPKLEQHARTLLSAGQTFVSYRWRDQPDYAVDLVEALLERGATVWWDKWAVAIATIQRPAGAKVHEKTLREILSDGIHRSSTLVALLTPSYSRSKWTSAEFDMALAGADSTRLVTVDLGGSVDTRCLNVRTEKSVRPQILAARLMRTRSVKRSPK